MGLGSMELGAQCFEDKVVVVAISPNADLGGPRVMTGWPSTGRAGLLSNLLQHLWTVAGLREVSLPGLNEGDRIRVRTWFASGLTVMIVFRAFWSFL